MADDDYFSLLGFSGPDEFDPDIHWAGETPNSPVEVPVGVDADGQKVSFDFSRFAGLDDHHLVVAEPGSGTTTLLRTLITGLSYRRSPGFHGYLVVEGKPDGEYSDIESWPHSSGRVKPGDGEEGTGRRLTQWLAGEIARRRACFEAIGAIDISDYQAKTAVNEKSTNSAETSWLPEFYVIIDNVTWLVGSEFDAIYHAIRFDGNILGIKLIMATPWETWVRLQEADYFDGIAPRFALGLNSAQASQLFGQDLPHDLITPGDAYLRALDGRLIRFTVTSAGEARSAEAEVGGETEVEGAGAP